MTKLVKTLAIVAAAEMRNNLPYTKQSRYIKTVGWCYFFSFAQHEQIRKNQARYRVVSFSYNKKFLLETTIAMNE